MPLSAPPEPPPIPGVRRSRISARGIDFLVTESGPTDGQPVICLHGWPQHHYEWRDLLEHPPPGLRIIAPDLPGYGWSGPAPHAWFKEEVASDVLALMDALGVERAALVGHDWGGVIGHLLALRAPERFSTYMVLNIAHPWQTPKTVRPHVWRSMTYMPMVAFAGVPVMTRTNLLWYVLRYQYVPRRWPWRSNVSDADLRWFNDRLHDPVVARAGRDTYRTFLTQEVKAGILFDKRRSHVPTRCVFGTKDFAVHRDLASAATANADDYTLELIPGAGHFIADERPELIRDRLTALVDRFPVA